MAVKCQICQLSKMSSVSNMFNYIKRQIYSGKHSDSEHFEHEMSSLRQATGEIWREKKEIKTFIHCPKKRGEKIKQDTFMILAR